MGTAGYRHIICVGTHKTIVLEFDKEIVYVDCEKEGQWTKPRDRPSLNVLEGPMEPFISTLAVRYMNQEDTTL